MKKDKYNYLICLILNFCFILIYSCSFAPDPRDNPLDPEYVGNPSNSSNDNLPQLEDPDDFTPPDSISNLTTSNITSNSVNLTWTATGDDGSTGTASSYEMRYFTGSSCPISAGNFSSGTLISGLPDPLAAGTSQNKTVTGLNPVEQHCFAIKVRDNGNNLSVISNIANFTTLASPLPDLILINFSVSPLIIQSGNNFTLSYQIKNIGTVAYSGVVWIKFYRNSSSPVNSSHESFGGTTEDITLSTGQTSSVLGDTMFDLVGSTEIWYYAVFVDSSASITELNETNNLSDTSAAVTINP